MAAAMVVGAACGVGWLSSMRRLVRIREARARFEAFGALGPSSAADEMARSAPSFGKAGLGLDP
jgi:hypothetical protein